MSRLINFKVTNSTPTSVVPIKVGAIKRLLIIGDRVGGFEHLTTLKSRLPFAVSYTKKLKIQVMVFF